jgi:hypothetical protein
MNCLRIYKFLWAARKQCKAAIGKTRHEKAAKKQENPLG